jgi:hypothetical protein
MANTKKPISWTVGCYMFGIALSVIGNHVSLLVGIACAVLALGCMATGAIFGERWIRSLWKTTPVASVVLAICLVGTSGLIGIEVYLVGSRAFPRSSNTKQGNCNGDTGDATASGNGSVANSGNCNNIDTEKKSK